MRAQLRNKGYVSSTTLSEKTRLKSGATGAVGGIVARTELRKSMAAVRKVAIWDVQRCARRRSENSDGSHQ